MSVEIYRFRKQPELGRLTTKEAALKAVSDAVRNQDKAAIVFDRAASSKKDFYSVRELRVGLLAFDLMSSYSKSDTEARLQFEADGVEFPLAAVLFLDIMAKSDPGTNLGTLMVAYNSELELEWDAID